jgi:hypothetical protein
MAFDNANMLPIANSALTLVGTRLLSAVSDASKEALLIRTNWDTYRRAILRLGLWKFAKEAATLTIDSAYSSTFGYQNRYALPANFIRLVSFNDLKGNSDGGQPPYQLRAGYVYTYMSYANLVYVADVTDVTQYDPLFCEAFSAYIYVKLCKSLTGTDANPDTLKRAMQEARFAGSTEDPSVQLDIDVWLQSRVGGPTLFRDPPFPSETTPDFP